MRLDGRTALITGGTQGVGAAIAKSLAGAGCNVILHGLKEDEHSRQTLLSCQQKGVRATCIFQDLAGDTESCIAELIGGVGKVQKDWNLRSIELLVNNAGTYRELPFLEMNFELFEATMRLNLFAGYFLTQKFAQNWIEHGIQGRVLFTGSINGLLSEPDHTAYDASKGAVHALVRSLCVSLAPRGIRVNGIAPGLVTTPLTGPGLMPGSDSLTWMQLHTPNGQVPAADVCGPAALFLLSDEADHVQGQVLLVDGGMSAWQQPDLPAELKGKLE